MKWLYPFVLVLATSAGLHGKTVLLERGSAWKYDDTGKDPGAGWNGADFDDSGWKRGAAPLGYGDEGMATTLGFGEDADQKHPATYLRSVFTLEEGAGFVLLRGEFRCDDGAAIYLNGKAIGRYNLGPGLPGHGSYARVPVSGALELRYASFEIDVDELKEGENLIAVSLHQASPSSSDLVFDLGLVGLTEKDLPKPGRLGEAARDAVEAYHRGHFVKPGMPIPDGYVDGGTYMKIREDGRIVATREVITVDRQRDKKLLEHIDFAKTTVDLPEIERAVRLAKYVDKLMTPREGREFAEAATGKLQDFRNAEILLGEVPGYCGAGVCRHRSLLYKILADEAGLKVGLRRGHLMRGGRPLGRHAWNELTLQDGSLRIVDVMNPEENFTLPEPADVHFKYGDIKGKPLYEAGDEEVPGGEAPPAEEREAA